MEVVKELNVTVALDPYLTLKALAAYCGLGVRTLRGYIADGGLPCYRVGGKVLVRRSDFDRWVERYLARNAAREAAESILTGVRK